MDPRRQRRRNRIQLGLPGRMAVHRHLVGLVQEERGIGRARGNPYMRRGLAGNQAPRRVLVLDRVDPPLMEIQLSLDISNGLEARQVPVYGPAGQPLPEFSYTTEIVSERSLKALYDVRCDCRRICGSKCDCLQLNGSLPYTKSGANFRLTSSRPIIFECNDCFCNANCKLRISRETYGQLELFYTGQDKGWGVRSARKIPVGAAVCEYVGLLRSKENEIDAEEDNYYSYDIMCLQLVREGVDRSPGIYQVLYKTEEDASPDTEFTVDATTYGNMARFLNHSCDPNLFSQYIAHPTNNMRMSAKQAHIVFFAFKDIDAHEELTTYYNSDGPGQRQCFCGSQSCRGIFSY